MPLRSSRDCSINLHGYICLPGLILEDSYHLEMQAFCSNRQRSDVKSNSETIQIIIQDVVNRRDQL